MTATSTAPTSQADDTTERDGSGPPNLIMYYTVHQAMRDSSAVLHDALAGMADDDRRRAAAIARWYRGFADELHAHHHIEDEIFFPALAERDASFEHFGPGLDADHVHLAQVIDDLTRAIGGLAEDEPWAPTRAQAVELSAELRDHLMTHLAIEDEDVIPLFAERFTFDEYVELEQQAVKRGSLKSMLFTVPWLVVSCEAKTRDEIFESVPAALKLLWKLTRRGYARRTSYALGIDVPVVRA